MSSRAGGRPAFSRFIKDPYPAGAVACGRATGGLGVCASSPAPVAARHRLAAPPGTPRIDSTGRSAYGFPERCSVVQNEAGVSGLADRTPDAMSRLEPPYRLHRQANGQTFIVPAADEGRAPPRSATPAEPGSGNTQRASRCPSSAQEPPSPAPAHLEKRV